MKIRIKSIIVKSKNIFLIIIAFLIQSCNNETEFYYGDWYFNGQNKIEIKTDNTITWQTSDMKLLDNYPLKIVNKDLDKIRVDLAPEIPIKILIESKSKNNNQCLVTTYKSYINENMIDEVIFAKRNPELKNKLNKPKQQTIIIPDSFIGEFYIVYKEESLDNSIIEIDKNGIGYSLTQPDVLQLYNANRVFRFQNSKQNIVIANPYDYTSIDSIKLEADFIIIQHGFNQSGRETWKKDNEFEIENQYNIEYFEIKNQKRHANKTDT